MKVLVLVWLPLGVVPASLDLHFDGSDSLTGVIGIVPLWTDGKPSLPTGRVVLWPASAGVGSILKRTFDLALELHCEWVISCGWQILEQNVLQVIIGQLKQVNEDLVLFQMEIDVPGNATLNRLIGTTVTAGHYASPGCAFRTDLLRSIPYRLNAANVKFWPEFLCQVDYVGASRFGLRLPIRIEEYPVERASLRAIWRTARGYEFHRHGMLCSLKYRNLQPIRYQDKRQGLYTSHHLALDLLRQAGARTILDVGCGPGFVSRSCRDAGLTVFGVDRLLPAEGSVDHFFSADLETDQLPPVPQQVDHVLLLDFVEHLSDPETFMLRLRDWMTLYSPEGRCLLSTPNVAFAAIRMQLLLGRFTYAERGILDITHKRLFTRSSLLRMFRECGFAVERFLALGPPFETLVPGRLGLILGKISTLAARTWPSMFAFQFMVQCRPVESPNLPGFATTDATDSSYMQNRQQDCKN